MSVRAKVRCDVLNNNEVTFNTVYETDSQKNPEDVSFTKATPWGTIKLGIDNPAAMVQFQLGAYYYVDFNKVSE